MQTSFLTRRTPRATVGRSRRWIARAWLGLLGVIGSAMTSTLHAQAVARLKMVPGIDARVFAVKQLTGGVLHAQYMIVDDQRVFVGSP